MPVLQLQTSSPVAETKQPALLAALSKIMAETIGKPERYVMITLRSGPMLMAGQGGETAFADIKSIGGLNGGVNGQLSRKICALLQETLGIPGDRVFINFTNVSASDWGWNGNTFG